MVFETDRGKVASHDDTERAYYVLVRFDKTKGDFVTVGKAEIDNGYNDYHTDIRKPMTVEPGLTLQSVRGNILAKYGAVVKIKITKL